MTDTAHLPGCLHRDGSAGNGTNGSDKRKAKAGRPTKYSESTVEKLCGALADGMPQKGACITAGISETTLATWRESHPDLSGKLEAAREVARHEALKGIKRGGDKDWRATDAWLKLTFPNDYRGNKVEVNASANASATNIVTVEQQRELQRKHAERNVILNERRAIALARN